MKGLYLRLRAALTPQAALLLAAAMLLIALAAPDQKGETALEKRTAKALSSMEGAGSVSVVIMTQESRSSWGTQMGEQTPCGAIAVAQGADDPLVRMEIMQALCALLGLPASSVSVVTGGK